MAGLFALMRRTAIVCVAGVVLPAVLALAQQWQTAETLPGVELQGLTPAQKTLALKVLRGQGCVCGCSMKLAQCRIEDPACSFSRGLADVVVNTAKQGKSESEIIT